MADFNPETGEHYGTRVGALVALSEVLGVPTKEITGMRKVGDGDAGPEFAYEHRDTTLHIRPYRHWMLGSPRQYQVWDGDSVIRSL